MTKVNVNIMLHKKGTARLLAIKTLHFNEPSFVYDILRWQLHRFSVLTKLESLSSSISLLDHAKRYAPRI